MIRLTRRKFSPGLLLVLSVATLVRMVMLWQWFDSPYWEYYRADHAFYKDWGLAIAGGAFSLGRVFEQGPLYAYWLGAIYAIFGDLDWPVLFVQLAAGVHTSCLVYWIGRRLRSEATGIGAGLITGLYGPLIYFELLVMKSWISPWLTVSICLIVLRQLDQVREPAKGWKPLISPAVVGCLIGLLCLVRENHVLLLLPAGIAGAVACSACSRWQRMIPATVMLAACLVTTLPATVHNLAVSGRLVWITSGGGEVFYMGWGPHATGYYQNPPFVRPDPFLEHEDFRLEASRRFGESVDHLQSSDYWMRTAIKEALTNPGRSVSLVSRKVLILFNDFEVPDSDFFTAARTVVPPFQFLPTLGWIAGLAFVGLFLLPWRDTRWLIILGILAVHVLSVVLTYNFARFRLGMIPILCLLSGSALTWILTGRKEEFEETAGVPVRAFGGFVAAAISLISFLPPPGFSEAGFIPIEEQFVGELNRRAELQQQARLLEARSFDGTDSEEALAIGQAWLAASQRFRAAEWLERALELDAGNVMAWQYLGVIRGKTGRFEVAADAFQQALNLTPDDPDLWANLGNARFHQALAGTLDHTRRTELLEAARSAYVTGLELDAHHQTCRQGLALCAGALSENGIP
ncbi:glycosyltransferase family 39 protein [Rubinisphaera margarita]|uniref:glycosyltransferase family 39 protein n=1 Tax=Rubinisphaera margarita TaxID=2909586 RepID=UPI001EE92CAA|nr:glycosyltransferase family 39 protein [Rubinisphaera margarita]MCG6156527.1 glycosyltransferase family 39 protein [Rubinisphaera margarita]